MWLMKINPQQLLPEEAWTTARSIHHRLAAEFGTGFHFCNTLGYKCSTTLIVVPCCSIFDQSPCQVWNLLFPLPLRFPFILSIRPANKDLAGANCERSVASTPWPILLQIDLCCACCDFCPLRSENISSWWSSLVLCAPPLGAPVQGSKVQLDPKCLEHFRKCKNLGSAYLT